MSKLAKDLRNNATKQENHLWYDFLRNYSAKFRRQHPIKYTGGKYIVDFYCHAAKLVIELDGSQHYTPQGIKNDEKRTHILEEKNLKVIRFKNSEIDNNFSDVCDKIHQIVINRLETKNIP